MDVVHPASLILPSLHAPTVLELVQMRMSLHHIYLVSHTVLALVDLAFNRVYCAADHFQSESSRGFTRFVDHMVAIAHIPVPTLLVALVYLHRVQLRMLPHYHPTNEAVFLGALIVAHKYAHDCTFKNKHWAAYSGRFRSDEICTMERDFLQLLDYRLSVSECNLVDFYTSLIGPLPPTPVPTPTPVHTPTLVPTPTPVHTPTPHVRHRRILRLQKGQMRGTYLNRLRKNGHGQMCKRRCAIKHRRRRRVYPRNYSALYKAIGFRTRLHAVPCL